MWSAARVLQHEQESRAESWKYNSVSPNLAATLLSIYPGKTMLKSLPCVKSNSRSSPIRIMEQSAHSFSPDLSSIVSESLGQ